MRTGPQKPIAKKVDRAAVMIQRKLSELILREIKDPRLPLLITVTDVQVSRDYSFAKVYFTALNGEPKEITQILNSAGGFLRSALARTSELRTVPALNFVYDESIEYGQRLSKIIDDVNPDEPVV
jgi:ribosome-binding factor A